jgi:hypothetical protein
MRLFEFVPICDHLMDDESVIERVFGPEFCVVDETGHLLATACNQNLLWRAKTLLDQHNALDWEAIEEGLTALKAKAEIVTQRNYDLAVRREIFDCVVELGDDFSLKAGSLT